MVQPSEGTASELILIELMPAFSFDETFRTYSAPSCIYISPRWEYVARSFRCGIMRIFLTASIEPTNSLLWEWLLITILSFDSEPKHNIFLKN